MEEREPAKVFEDRLTPGDWRVEWEDEDGGVEVPIFSGPDARQRAIQYAMIGRKAVLSGERVPPF